MAWLWARLHIRANSRSAGGEKLGYLAGGFKVIITALETELRKRGVTLRLNTTVDKFLADERAAMIQGEKVPFDVCAFTGPSSALVRLLPASASSGDYAARLRRINYLGATCLIFTSGQSLGDHYWVNVNEPDAPFLVFLQHTCLTGKEAYGGNNVYYIGAYLEPDGEIFSLSDEDLTRRWFGYLPKLFPDFDSRQVEQKFIFRFRDAQHIVDTGYEEKIPEHQTPLPGVFLANFSQIFPEDRGTNFAVREGEKIAGLIQKTLAP
jgi:protoporphyrinogen oxidase